MQITQSTITHGVGIVLGSLLLLSVAWVWLRRQKFGLNGFGMSLIGVVLVSLTMWQSMSVSFSAGTIELELERLQAEVAETKQQLAAAETEIAQVGQANSLLTRELVSLAEVSNAQGQAQITLQRELQQANVINRVEIDEQALRPAMQDFQRLRERAISPNP